MSAKDTKPVSTELDSEKIVQPADVAMLQRVSGVGFDALEAMVSFS